MPEYLTVSEAAAALGLKERTVQKYCASGKLTAHRASTPTGDAWQIDSASLEALEAANERTNKAPNAHRTNGERTPKQQSPISNSTERTPNAQGNERTTNGEHMAASLAQSREEILFLRSMLEARDRDAAELRAALRKALDVMPKAISASTPVAENNLREEPSPAPIIPAGDAAPVAQKPPARRGKKPRELTPWQRIGARILGIR